MNNICNILDISCIAPLGIAGNGAIIIIITINNHISLYLENQLRYLVGSAIRHPEQLARER